MIARVQVAAYCASAVGSGTMFVRWWRLKEEDRPRVWLLYGWFSGLMCVGSVFGAVAWAAWMQFLLARFSSFVLGVTLGVTHAQTQSLLEQQYNWEAAFFIPSAIDFVCLTVAKLMVLERMADFAVGKGDGMSRRLAVGGRIVMASVVVGYLVIVSSSVAAAVYVKESVSLYSASRAAYAANITNDYINLGHQARQKTYAGINAASVLQFSEVVVLLIIIFAFAVVGIASARRVSSALRHMNDQHGAAGRQLRRQIVGTTAFVFVTFLLRAVFTGMLALARALQNPDAECAVTASNACDYMCFNQWRLMDVWIILTPEYQAMVSLISSPVAIIVALWGMTSKRALQLMKSSGKQSAAARDDSEQIPVVSMGGHRGHKGKVIAMVETAVVIKK
jgi:hypothetical protein